MGTSSMTSRREWLRPAPSILMTVWAFSISLCTAPQARAADQAVIADAGDGLIPGSDRTSTRPPATFFSINDVLAKLDRQRGRGPNALRMAALSPSNTATDAQPDQKGVPPVGTEPFGLFTFRAPEGILWRKWRGIEGDITKEQVILDNSRAKADSCPSYDAQFRRLINA